MIRIVTDSSVDLREEVARELDITVVPLSIHFGTRTYIDGEDIDAPAFYRLLRTESAHPRTAQPPAGRFEEAYRALAAAGHEIVTITLASTLSGTYNSAMLAARNVPEARVRVIDSGTISMAMGFPVIHAARLAREGQDADEVEAAVRALLPRLRICLMADTLTYLQRGGRIGRAGALVGTMLNIKPIITLREGVVIPLQRVRTRQKALHEMAHLIEAAAPIEDICVLHTAAPELATEFAAMLQPIYEGRPVPTQPLGPVVGVHLGPGSVGVAGLARGRGDRLEG